MRGNNLQTTAKWELLTALGIPYGLALRLNRFGTVLLIEDSISKEKEN